MPTTQIADIIVPAQFTAYQVENSLVSTALFQSGAVVKNAAIASQLEAGATNFTVPFWQDLPDVEADITNDDPTILSTPQKIAASKLTVRKSFLHQSWSEMNLASERAGSSASQRAQPPPALDVGRKSTERPQPGSTAERVREGCRAP